MRLLPTVAAVAFGLLTVAVYGIWLSGTDDLTGPTMTLAVAGGLTALVIVFGSAYVVARQVRRHFAKARPDGPEDDYRDPPAG